MRLIMRWITPTESMLSNAHLHDVVRRVTSVVFRMIMMDISQARRKRTKAIQTSTDGVRIRTIVLDSDGASYKRGAGYYFLLYERTS